MAFLVFALAGVVGAFWFLYGRPSSRPVGVAPKTETVDQTATNPPAPSGDAMGHISRDPDPAPLKIESTTVPPPPPVAAAAPVSGAPVPLEDLISRVIPAVVTIQTGSVRGSGFFVAPDTILTNVHVVGSDSSVTVKRGDGSTTTARVDATAPAFDIAVLKVSSAPGGQPTIRMGSAATARVGEEVIAIGTPLGFLQNTVSRGIVSGLREVEGATLVQTDAAINPGNSGGPLMDRNGTAIGIIKSGYAGRDGLSFAVAIDHARALLEGKRTPTPAATVSSASAEYRPLAPAVPSPGDQQRMNAAKSYEQTIAQLARQADALDGRWRAFRGSCYEGAVVGSFDHEWFALWEPSAMRGAVAPGCGPLFNDLRRQANDVRSGVAAADEQARRDDVYPGTRRDVLRKYRLDYSGWNR
jgi:S1-C subfamily serine protease